MHQFSSWLTTGPNPLFHLLLLKWSMDMQSIPYHMLVICKCALHNIDICTIIYVFIYRYIQTKIHTIYRYIYLYVPSFQALHDSVQRGWEGAFTSERYQAARLHGPHLHGKKGQRVTTISCFHQRHCSLTLKGNYSLYSYLPSVWMVWIQPNN